MGYPESSLFGSHLRPHISLEIFPPGRKGYARLTQLASFEEGHDQTANFKTEEVERIRLTHGFHYLAIY
jgi:hypothetical protein